MILTEVGPNLEAFATEDDFVSWLHLCPRTAISGGKPLAKKRSGTGANRLGGLLRLGARTLFKSKSALGAEFRRVARRKNGATAIFALAPKLGKLVYRMLRYGQTYIDIGEKAEEERHLARRLHHLTNQASQFGFQLIPHAAQG